MSFKRMTSMLLALVMLVCFAAPAAAEVKSTCPLVDTQTVEYVETQDEFYNVLLLGIEQGFGSYHQSDWENKPTIRECHTDVMMVVSFNKTKQIINLISIPRDTLVYVPGVYGIYKANAAFNLADSNEEGFKKSEETVSWVLGGIRIDAYCAVTMSALVNLGNEMGGLDFFLDMSYTGSSSTKYTAGQRHLNGMGIMDYCRARTNATLDNNDVGRTQRCRKIITAIIEKLRGDLSLVQHLWDYSQNDDIYVYTDLTLNDVLSVWNMIQTYSSKIGSYGLDGFYGEGGLDWWFTHTYQSERQTTLYEAFGITASTIPYVSRDFTNWLIGQGGFRAVRSLRLTREIMNYARAYENPSAAMKTALTQLEEAYDTTVSAFDLAAYTLDEVYRQRMAAARREMEAAADTVAQLFRYPESYTWERYLDWDEDPYINEYYQLNWK